MKTFNRRTSFLASGMTLLILAISNGHPAHSAEMDNQIMTFLQIEQLEYRSKKGVDTYNWDAQGWIGDDYNKLWFKTEGAALTRGQVEEAEVQVLYSRLISNFFDAQVGLRQDFKPDPDRTFAVIGLQGLAPYFFELDTAAFVSNKGEVSARLKGEYELLLTQKLILQPSAEANLAMQKVAERGIGSGLNNVELGLRLRYEIQREFAPYIGINWERKIGETAQLARDEGERADAFSLMVGIRMWF